MTSRLREYGAADAVQIHVLQRRLYLAEPVSRSGVAVDVNDRIAGDEAHRDDIERGLECRQLVLSNPLPPHMPPHFVQDLARIALENHLARIDDRHPATQLTHIFDDMRRENHDDLAADL